MNGIKESFIVTLSDYIDLALFLANFENEKRNQEFWLNRFHLWWDDNPSFSNGFLRGWLLRDNGKIVGFIGCIPSAFLLDGQERILHSCTTWRVLEKNRNQSMELLFKLINESKKTILFVTTPNAVTGSILPRIGFRTITENRTKSVVRINYNSILNSIYTRTGLEFMTIKKLMRLTAECIMALRIANCNLNDLLCVKELKMADSQFDHLWDRTRNQHLNTNVRTYGIINWYCFASCNYKKILLGCYKDETLVGYMILGTDLSSGYKNFECLDLWYVYGEIDSILSLFISALKYAVENSYDTVTIHHFNDEIKNYFANLQIGKTHTYKRKDYFKAKPSISKKITEKNSYIVRFVGDVGL